LYPENIKKEIFMGLTDLQVRKLAAKKSRYEVSDGKGLAIRVTPTGVKTWVFRYQFDGMPRRMTMGNYPGVGLAEARESHGAALAALQRGVDPGAEALEKKAKRKAAPKVADLLDEFWEVELGKTPSGKERRRLVEKDVIPHWGRRKVTDITRRDAVLLIDRVRQRAPVGASRLQSVIVRMFNFAAERGMLGFSPLVGMRRPKETPRVRVLTDNEIKALWSGLDLENQKIDLYAPVKLALRLILLTGQRPGEISGMRWSEIDDQTWTIPVERAKNRQENRVPLGPMALEALETARMYSHPDCEFVFESSYKPKKPIIRQSITRAVDRHWAEMGIEKKFTPHDLRRTLRTRLAEIGVSDVVAERVLGHKLQGLLAVYNQHPYDAEKRAALLRWEVRLAEILGHETKKQNVIKFVPRSA
jgi:integrase